MKLDERTITPEIRHKALEILDSGKPNAYIEVERLLGWESQVSMTGREMARLLGVTYYHLQYLLERNYLHEKERQLITTRKQATSMPGRIVTSQKLGFSLWLPDGWYVDSEDDSIIDLSEEARSHYEEWLSSLEHRDLKKEYRSLRKELEDAIVSFEAFAQNVNLKTEFRKQRWQEKLSVKMRQGFQIGCWSASSSEGESLSPVEVAKFHFREPMTAAELCKAEKPEPDDLLAGKRPKQTFTVDGMEVVRFYCLWKDIDNAQFATYMVNELTGWVIDCWSRADDAFRLRPLFQRIVASFHRL